MSYRTTHRATVRFPGFSFPEFEIPDLSDFDVSTSDYRPPQTKFTIELELKANGTVSMVIDIDTPGVDGFRANVNMLSADGFLDLPPIVPRDPNSNGDGNSNGGGNSNGAAAPAPKAPALLTLQELFLCNKQPEVEQLKQAGFIKDRKECDDLHITMKVRGGNQLSFLRMFKTNCYNLLGPGFTYLTPVNVNRPFFTRLFLLNDRVRALGQDTLLVPRNVSANADTLQNLHKLSASELDDINIQLNRK